MHDLYRPGPQHLRAQRVPLIERDPVRFWRALALVLGLVVLGLLVRLVYGAWQPVGAGVQTAGCAGFMAAL